jgi:excisionase family DNA binding protein
MTDTPYMTIKEAAAHVRAKESTILNNCRTKRMPYYKGPSGGYLFDKPMLDKWMQSRVRKVKPYNPPHERAKRTESVRG